MLPWLPPPATRSPLPPRSLAAIVHEDLLAQILRGGLAPGERINEPDVASRLGVSRVPVREALRQLESTGLVEARPHAGVFVRRLAPGEVADLYAFRGALDAFAGRLAAGLADAPRRALARILEASIAAMRRASRKREVTDYYAENLRFHWAIVEAAGNAALSESYRGVVQRLHLWRLRNLAQPVGMAASIAEHDAIAGALREGDAALAGQLLADHVGAAHERLRNHLEEKP